MRWDRNPLYKGPSQPWSRRALIIWIAAMAAFEAWLLIDAAYVEAAIFGAMAVVGAVLAVLRGWNP